VSRYFVTTPIYYVKDAPHVGHAYTTVNADALARWHRLIGDDVFFLTGTDEHGQKVARAAEEQGMAPLEWTDQLSPRFAEAWAGLDISNDDFIRTTEIRHRVAVEQFLGRINDNGFIYKDTYRGLYCVPCERYYAADELLPGGLCPDHRIPLEELEEENYFFKLSEFQQPLMDWYAANVDVVLPESKRNEALGFIKGGLNDISITRTSIDWGVRVPWDDSHVFYVWYDALINYVTAIGYGQDQERFDAWWPNVHHLIGKEITRFHCVWWPAMCMAAGIDPPAHVQVHGWLLLGGDKMSNSSVNRISPSELIDEYGVDPVRYHLLRDIPLGSDGEFSAEGISARYNADLANNLGNLLSRVATVVDNKSAGPLEPAGRHRRRRAGGNQCGMGGGRSPPGPRVDVAVDPRDQRRTRGVGALEGRPWSDGRRGTGQRPRGAAHRGRAGVTGHAVDGPRGVAAYRHARGPRERAPAGHRCLGRLSRWPHRGEGRPALPTTQGLTRWTMPWSSGSTRTATSRTSSTVPTTASSSPTPTAWPAPSPGRPKPG
jgi:methionyl-tRNA synthetase